ncbi:MAG: divergent polysaccharide deacetylase family protein [Syntrophobacteraceae bacterium]
MNPPHAAKDVAGPANGVSPKDDGGWKRPKEPPGRDRTGPSDARERRDEQVRVALVPPAVLSPDHGRPTPPPQVGPRLTAPVARVAIVIDDFGLDLEMAKKFAALPFPVTFSILPYLPHSIESAEIARSHNRQVMLHLPMEPQGYPKVKPGQGALLLSMNDHSVVKALHDALQSTPYVAGVNNHMGSRFTEKANRMRVVIEEIGHKGLFFLDSATSPKSVGAQLAQELQIAHGRRDVFLDHTRTDAAVKGQLKQLMEKARLQGTAVAIGHPHEVTLRVLQGAGEMLRREGIEVVPAGEIMARK